jgi:cell division protein FtsA
MSKSKIITGIDIGTSKISVIVCSVSGKDINVLGFGTSIFKGVQKGIIKDRILFSNALQNAIKRAQVAANEPIEDVFVNIPNGNSRFSIQTGIVQNNENQMVSSKENAMKKSAYCIDKKDCSILHLIPINKRGDGKQVALDESRKFNSVEIDTGIILCDTGNLKRVISTIKGLNINIKGILSDFLSAGAILIPQESSQSYLIIDIGAQVTLLSIFKNNKLKFAQAIQIGSEQITQDLSICLKCSVSEAERVKILYGQLQRFKENISEYICVQCHDGQKNIKVSLIISIIESRVNQLIQLAKKYLNGAPEYNEIILTGSGANLRGISGWVASKLEKNISQIPENIYNEMNINSNYIVAMGQVVYGHQIGLVNTKKHSELKKLAQKIFSH